MTFDSAPKALAWPTWTLLGALCVGPALGCGDDTPVDPAVDAGSSEDAGPTGDLARLPDTPWDPTTITEVGFTPALECPVLSYVEANSVRFINLQAIEITASGCTFDEGSVVTGQLRVELGAIGAFDPADPNHIDQMDPVIGVETASGPGDHAVRMYREWVGDERIYYGMVFQVGTTEVLLIAERLGLEAEELETLADLIASHVEGSEFTPSTADVETTGAAFCSLYDGPSLAAGLGRGEPTTATWARRDPLGCDWRTTGGSLVEVSQPLGGSQDPNTDDPDLRIDDLGVPAARDRFADWILNLELNGVHVVVSSASPEVSRAIAINLIERAGL